MNTNISKISISIKSLLSKATFMQVLALLAVSIIAAMAPDLDRNRFSQPETFIGNQIWMAANLDVATFRNGDPIPEAKTNEEWIDAANAKRPAWCYYDNDPVNGKKYGRMYNWYAVNDPRGLAPAGWHIPSLEEWIQFEKSVEGNVAKMLFECPQGTNGFCTKRGGYRFSNGKFSGLEEFIYLSGSTGETIEGADGKPAPVVWGRGLHVVDRTHMRCGLGKDFGLYVRCIRDSDKMKRLPSGLQYTILKQGHGHAAKRGQQIMLFETTSYQTGQVLYSNEDTTTPVKVLIGGNQATRAVDEALLGMREGEVKLIIAPPNLVKRTEYPSNVHPDSTLVIKLILHKIL